MTHTQYHKELLIIMPEDDAQAPNARLTQVLEYCTEGLDIQLWTKAVQFESVQNRRILFVLNLGQDGINIEAQQFLRQMRRNPKCFQDCIGAILIDGQHEL